MKDNLRSKVSENNRVLVPIQITKAYRPTTVETISNRWLRAWAYL